MNRSQEILDYLSEQTQPTFVVLAPNAPPVARIRNELSVIHSYVLSAGDVFDTLVGLKSQTARQRLDPAVNSETFSFSLRKAGRIRVSYLTQRGSKVVTVACVPFCIPTLESLCEDAGAATALLSMVREAQNGIIAVSGCNAVANSALVYALLDKVNEATRTLIGIVEEPLTYLMAHRNSIVVQCDVGSDAKTIGEGVDSMLPLHPAILFVGGIRRGEDLLALGRAAPNCRLFIASSSCMDATAILEGFPAGSCRPGAVREVVRVACGSDGKLMVRLGQTPAVP